MTSLVFERTNIPFLGSRSSEHRAQFREYHLEKRIRRFFAESLRRKRLISGTSIPRQIPLVIVPEHQKIRSVVSAGSSIPRAGQRGRVSKGTRHNHRNGNERCPHACGNGPPRLLMSVPASRAIPPLAQLSTPDSPGPSRLGRFEARSCRK